VKNQFNYIGIQLDEVDLDKKILDMIRNCISTLKDTYNSPDLKKFHLEVQKEDFLMTSKWRNPPHWHITKLFVGGNKSLRIDPILMNFKEEEFISIDLEGFIFVPNKIITCICFPASEVKNKIPHLTVMINEWKAKESNTVCEALFVDGPFKKEYETVFRDKEFKGNFVESVNITIGSENLDVYLMKITPSLHFEGITKYFL
jgi:hypothetical protein